MRRLTRYSTSNEIAVKVVLRINLTFMLRLRKAAQKRYKFKKEFKISLFLVFSRVTDKNQQRTTTPLLIPPVGGKVLQRFARTFSTRTFPFHSISSSQSKTNFISFNSKNVTTTDSTDTFYFLYCTIRYSNTFITRNSGFNIKIRRISSFPN